MAALPAPPASSNTAQPGELLQTGMEITTPQDSSKCCFTLQHQSGKFHARGDKEPKVPPPSYSSFWGKNPKFSHQMLHIGQTLCYQRSNKLTKHSIFCSWQSPMAGSHEGNNAASTRLGILVVHWYFSQMKITKLLLNFL